MFLGLQSSVHTIALGLSCKRVPALNGYSMELARLKCGIVSKYREKLIAQLETLTLTARHETISQCLDNLAGAEGLEPTTLGFGDRCSTN